jgi:hypothetical protein
MQLPRENGLTETMQTATLALHSPMVASAGGTKWDLAAPQFGRNCGAVQYYRIFNILKLKLYNIYNVL